MKTIEIPFSIFESEAVFHDSFSKIMGFPEFYGKNWNAWIDCMSYIDDPPAGMSTVLIESNEHIEFNITGYEFNEDLDNSETFKNFFICSGFVNSRFKEAQSNTRIIIDN